MEWIIVGVLIIVTVLLIGKFTSNKKSESEKLNENDKLPYLLNDSILTDAEKNFHHSLKMCIGDKAVICPKVGLGDIFFVNKSVPREEKTSYRNKIDRKHVDFLLCDQTTMKPLCGIELDDFSHTNKKNYERDVFVEKVYKAANLELIRFSAKSGYTVNELETALSPVLNITNETSVEKNTDEHSICPKCNVPMVLRKASKGKNAGKEFYGCPNYPNCKQVININESIR